LRWHWRRVAIAAEDLHDLHDADYFEYLNEISAGMLLRLIKTNQVKYDRSHALLLAISTDNTVLDIFSML
jgi:hypothetical protein